jgi:hypothetical protein
MLILKPRQQRRFPIKRIVFIVALFSVLLMSTGAVLHSPRQTALQAGKPMAVAEKEVVFLGSPGSEPNGASFFSSLKLTNTGPPLPALRTNAVSVAPPKQTNFPHITLGWTDPNTNDSIASYVVSWGNADGITNAVWTAPASNNEFSFYPPPPSCPMWIAVQLIGSNGLKSGWSTNWYTNVPAWPKIAGYPLHGTNWIGWEGAAGHSDTVQRLGVDARGHAISTNQIANAVVFQSNTLAALPMTPGLPATNAVYRVMRQ